MSESLNEVFTRVEKKSQESIFIFEEIVENLELLLNGRSEKKDKKKELAYIE